MEMGLDGDGRETKSSLRNWLCYDRTKEMCKIKSSSLIEGNFLYAFTLMYSLLAVSPIGFAVFSPIGTPIICLNLKKVVAFSEHAG